MIVLELPWPPSVNAIWRSGKGHRGKKPRYYLDPKYQAWRKDADWAVVAARRKGCAGPILGRFTASLVLDERKRRSNTDCDNRIKAVLDCLQRMLVIETDALADRVDVSWGSANGVRVIIAPVTT